MSAGRPAWSRRARCRLGERAASSREPRGRPRRRGGRPSRRWRPGQLVFQEDKRGKAPEESWEDGLRETFVLTWMKADLNVFSARRCHKKRLRKSSSSG